MASYLASSVFCYPVYNTSRLQHMMALNCNKKVFRGEEAFRLRGPPALHLCATAEGGVPPMRLDCVALLGFPRTGRITGRRALRCWQDSLDKGERRELQPARRRTAREGHWTRRPLSARGAERASREMRDSAVSLSHTHTHRGVGSHRGFLSSWGEWRRRRWLSGWNSRVAREQPGGGLRGPEMKGASGSVEPGILWHPDAASLEIQVAD